MDWLLDVGKQIYSEAGLVALLLFLGNVWQYFQNKKSEERADKEQERADEAFDKMHDLSVSFVDTVGKLTLAVELIRDRIKR